MSTIAVELDQLPGLFGEIGEQISKMEFAEPLAYIADQLRDLHEGYFDAETGPSGEPWSPWFYRSESAPNNHPTLFVTGRLRQSMIDGPDHIESIDGNTLTFGTGVPYASIHNEGASIITGIPLISRGGHYLPAGSQITIPQREFVGMNQPSVDRAGETVLEYVVAQLKG